MQMRTLGLVALFAAGAGIGACEGESRRRPGTAVEITSHALASCDNLPAAVSVAVSDQNGVPALQCPGCSGNIYQIAADQWDEVMQLVYLGVHRNGVRDCNSDVRHSLVNQWGSLFPAACPEGNCTQLRHAWRNGDNSPRTVEFLTRFGRTPLQNPFCNGGGVTLGGSGNPATADYLDLDPVRRRCDATEQICGRDGTLGLVLPIVPPSNLTADENYPPQQCGVGQFAMLAPALFGGPSTCPTGLPKLFNKCFQPVLRAADGTFTANCVARRFPVQGLAHNNLDGRAYNLPAKRPNGTYHLDPFGRHFSGAFHRIHMTTPLDPSSPACREPGSGRQIECLRVASPCTLSLTDPAPLCKLIGEGCSADSDCCLRNCQRPAGSATGTCESPAPLISTEVPGDQKQNDPRLSPPSVRQLFVREGPGGLANVVAELRSPNDGQELGRHVTVQFDDGELTLRDDGRALDERAGDSLFTAGLTVPFQTVLDNQLQAQSSLDNLGLLPLAVPSFRQRDLIERRVIDPVRPTDKQFKVLTCGALPVNPRASLVINDLKVVEDPARTFNSCTGAGTAMGAWTFGRLMTAMAGTANASDFVERWLTQWLGPQAVDNGLTTAARPTMSSVLASWPRLLDGRLNLVRAPFKLLAIINRPDLGTNGAYGGGCGMEVRFVFQLLPGGCTATAAQPFIVILEYGVPICDCQGKKDWAAKWWGLSFAGPIGSASYNGQLQDLTNVVTVANAAPGKPNGSAINQVRTNDFLLAQPWDLREFRLSGATPAPLAAVTVKQNPDQAYNAQVAGPRAPLLGTWIDNHRFQVCNGTHTVTNFLDIPDLGPFLGPQSLNPPGVWQAPITLPTPACTASDLRQRFSLATCNGCHGAETATSFTHVGGVNGFGALAPLSQFLMGPAYNVPDPILGAPARPFGNEMAHRMQVLNELTCATCRRNVLAPPVVERISVLPSFDPPGTPIEIPMVPLLPPIAVSPTLATH